MAGIATGQDPSAESWWRIYITPGHRAPDTPPLQPRTKKLPRLEPALEDISRGKMYLAAVLAFKIQPPVISDIRSSRALVLSVLRSAENSRVKVHRGLASAARDFHIHEDQLDGPAHIGILQQPTGRNPQFRIIQTHLGPLPGGGHPGIHKFSQENLGRPASVIGSALSRFTWSSKAADFIYSWGQPGRNIAVRLFLLIEIVSNLAGRRATACSNTVQSNDMAKTAPCTRRVLVLDCLLTYAGILEDLDHVCCNRINVGPSGVELGIEAASLASIVGGERGQHGLGWLQFKRTIDDHALPLTTTDDRFQFEQALSERRR
ncbi:hypothetical protein DFH08DRAFT_826681 [Mycena albidolilacea]|uniref:Uncharacterized protein n=1 Tax=Mycena albidolilacea TaxID=1033008 RepID=A0AAD6YZQ0_9AGAR|nr:hypothetical protein DFH08DRAFT_826681 [Mycena albidolilacea]